MGHQYVYYPACPTSKHLPASVWIFSSDCEAFPVQIQCVLGYSPRTNIQGFPLSFLCFPCNFHEIFINSAGNRSIASRRISTAHAVQSTPQHTCVRALPSLRLGAPLNRRREILKGRLGEAIWRGPHEGTILYCTQYFFPRYAFRFG